MLDGTEAQGVHLALSGSALARLREAGLTDRALCQHVTDNNGKAARLDVAVNLHGGLLTVQDIHRAYMQGRAKTPARSGLRFKGLNMANDGLTLGNRTSARFMRCYDKRAEQHLEGETWLRFEVECKRKVAQNVALAVANSDNTRAVCNRVVKDYMDIPSEAEYVAALADNNALIDDVPRKLTSYDKWLIEQVAPSIVQHSMDDPDKDYLAILTSAVEALREALTGATADDESYRAVGMPNS